MKRTIFSFLLAGCASSIPTYHSQGTITGTADFDNNKTIERIEAITTNDHVAFYVTGEHIDPSFVGSVEHKRGYKTTAIPADVNHDGLVDVVAIQEKEGRTRNYITQYNRISTTFYNKGNLEFSPEK